MNVKIPLIVSALLFGCDSNKTIEKINLPPSPWKEKWDPAEAIGKTDREYLEYNRGLYNELLKKVKQNQLKIDYVQDPSKVTFDDADSEEIRGNKITLVHKLNEINHYKTEFNEIDILNGDVVKITPSAYQSLLKEIDDLHNEIIKLGGLDPETYINKIRNEQSQYYTKIENLELEIKRVERKLGIYEK